MAQRRGPRPRQPVGAVEGEAANPVEGQIAPRIRRRLIPTYPGIAVLTASPSSFRPGGARVGEVAVMIEKW